MPYLLTHKKSGERQIVNSLDGYRTRCFVIDELERMPGEFEDIVDGRIVHNAKREADTLAGETHIAEARIQKRIEAMLVKSGLAIGAGLLAPEAAARKLSLSEMADLVLERAGEFADVELARQNAALAFEAGGVDVVDIGNERPAGAPIDIGATADPDADELLASEADTASPPDGSADS